MWEAITSARPQWSSVLAWLNGRTVSWCSTEVAKTPAQRSHLAHRSQDQDAISVERGRIRARALTPVRSAVRGVRRIEHAVDAELWQRFTRIPNSRRPLPNRIGASAISSSSTTPMLRYCWITFAPPRCGCRGRQPLPGLLKRLCWPVVAKKKSSRPAAPTARASRASARIRRVKRRLRRPADLALFKHPLAHDAHTATLHRMAQHVVHRTSLPARTKAKVLAEILLLENPAHQPAPLRPQFL